MERERKKAEKQKKFDEKKAKASNAAASVALSKTKEKKARQEEEKEVPLPKYVEETPPGQKKSMLINHVFQFVSSIHFQNLNPLMIPTSKRISQAW